MKKLLLLSIAAMIVVNGYSKTYDLRMKLQPGTVYKMNTKTEALTKIVGMDMTMMMEVGMSYTVKAFKDSVYDLDITYGRMSMDMEMAGKKLSTSSPKDSTEQVMANMLNTMEGVSFNAKMTDKGKIIEVTNLEKAFETILNSTDTKSVSAKRIEEAKTQISQMYSEEAFRQGIEMSMEMFPDKPVKKGDTWTISRNNAQIPMVISSSYTLDNITKDHYEISFTSQVSLSSDNPMYAQIIKDMAGKMTGKMVLDRETCWNVSSEIAMEITFSVILPGKEPQQTVVKANTSIY